MQVSAMLSVMVWMGGWEGVQHWGKEKILSGVTASPAGRRNSKGVAAQGLRRLLQLGRFANAECIEFFSFGFYFLSASGLFSAQMRHNKGGEGESPARWEKVGGRGRLEVYLLPEADDGGKSETSHGFFFSLSPFASGGWEGLAVLSSSFTIL